MIHKHIWNETENVGAFWEKQEGQTGSRYYYEGKVKECRCGRIIFFPKDHGDRPVEAERYDPA